MIMLWAFVWIGNLQKLTFFLEIFAPLSLLEMWVRDWSKRLFPWNFTRFSTFTEPVSSAYFDCTRENLIIAKLSKYLYIKINVV